MGKRLLRFRLGYGKWVNLREFDSSVTVEQIKQFTADNYRWFDKLWMEQPVQYQIVHLIDTIEF